MGVASPRSGLTVKPRVKFRQVLSSDVKPRQALSRAWPLRINGLRRVKGGLGDWRIDPSGGASAWRARRRWMVPVLVWSRSRPRRRSWRRSGAPTGARSPPRPRSPHRTSPPAPSPVCATVGVRAPAPRAGGRRRRGRRERRRSSVGLPRGAAASARGVDISNEQNSMNYEKQKENAAVRESGAVSIAVLRPLPPFS